MLWPNNTGFRREPYRVWCESYVLECWFSRVPVYRLAFWPLERKTSVPTPTLGGGVFVDFNCFLGCYYKATEYAGVLLLLYGFFRLDRVQLVAFRVGAPDVDGARHSGYTRKGGEKYVCVDAIPSLMCASKLELMKRLRPQTSTSLVRVSVFIISY